MSDSKVFMFPENGYNNGNNGILGGWGGGILGFILGILLGNGGFFGNGGWGNNGGIPNQLNNDANTSLIMNAINGTDSDIRLLATTLNSDVNETKAAINAVQASIAQVGAQNGMGFLQVVNAIQSGNTQLSRQLCECCCENRLLTTQQGYENRIQTIEQTNQLGSQAERNTRAITDAIGAQSTMITKEFCDLKEREMQNQINSLTAENTALKTQGAFSAMLAPIYKDLADIKASQPQTVTLPNNAWTAVPTLLANAGADFISSYWANRLTNATSASTTTTPATGA